MNENHDATTDQDNMFTDEDYGPFDEFSQTDFERWLVSGMQGYFHENCGPNAFSGADGFIRHREYLVEGLADAYQDWNAAQQGLFRAALADVLASLPALPENAIIFEHLLSLAATIRAPEILRVLPVRIGADDFGLMVESDEGHLFDIALLSVSQLAAPRKDAATCLRALIGAKHFHFAYAGNALLALCRADAGNLPEHLNQLRGYLAAMFREYETESKGRRALAEAVLDTIGIEHLKQALPKLIFRGEGRESDSWLAEALMFGKGAPLSYEDKREQGVFLWRRDSYEKGVPVRQSQQPHTTTHSPPSPSNSRAWKGFGIPDHQRELAGELVQD